MGKLIVLTVLAIIASFWGSGSAIQYFDLGYVVDETTLFYPGQTRYADFELYKDILGYNFTEPDHIRYFFAMFSFCMGEHGGTHVDAPYHFNEFGWKLGEIPLELLVDRSAVVVDVENACFSSNDPNQFKVEVSHILDHERKYGEIRAGSVVMLHTGWGRYWPNFDTYFGVRNGTFVFPGLSGEAAAWLVKERKIVGVGIDTASIDIGNVAGNPVAHLALCGNNIYIIENVANLKTLMNAIGLGGQSGGLYVSSSSGATAGIGAEGKCDLRTHVLPMKTKGTGGQARVLAYCKNY